MRGKRIVLYFYLRRSEVTEHGEVSLFAQLSLQLLGHSDTATHHDNIDVVRRALKEYITHIATNHIALDTHRVGYAADLVEDFLIQYPG